MALPGCANNRGNTNKINLSYKNGVGGTSKTDSNRPGGNKPDKNKADSRVELKPFSKIILKDTRGLRRNTIHWSWAYSPKENAAMLSKYNAYAFGETSKKVIYLTFDEGYENGYTASILDTLKENKVKAAFFVTKDYVTGSFNGKNNSELVKRMMNEGHIIANHSVHHKSMPSITDETAFNLEFTDNEIAVNNIDGVKISKFFRPPMGDFSELSLYYTQKLGYKSIFFSLAYHDFDPKNQPDSKIAKKGLLKGTKPGMICLLHAVSKTNTEILGSLIKEWEAQGYKFKSLNELI